MCVSDMAIHQRKYVVNHRINNRSCKMIDALLSAIRVITELMINSSK